METLEDCANIEAVRIRLARPSEVIQRCTCAEEAYADTQSNQPRGSFPPCLAEGKIESTLTLFAEADGRVVASVNLSLQSEQVGMIDGFWIDQNWQGSVLPMRLVVAVLEEGKKLGCLKVDMDPALISYVAVAVLLDKGVMQGNNPEGDVDRRALDCL